MEVGGSRDESWLPPTLVAVAAALVYARSLANGFAYDDVGVILENPTVHDLGDQLRIWLTPYWPGPDARTAGLYRPLTTFLFAVQWAVGGGGPVLFHVVNVLLHAAVSVLVYVLVRSFVAWRAALGAGLLFAVHPVHVEAVANGVGQAELVSSGLVMAAAVLYVRRPFEGEVRAGLRRMIAACFVLGLLAKEHAIVLPALLLVLDVAQGRVRRSHYFRSVAKLGVLLAGAGGVYLALRSVVLGGGLVGDVTFQVAPLRDGGTRVMTALSVWPHYLRLMFFPLHLSAMYDPDTIPFVRTLTPAVVAGSALVLLVLAASVLRTAWPAIGLGSAWFLATILPVSNLLFPIGTVLGERTLYLPSVALCIGAGFGLDWALRKWVAPEWARTLALGALTTVLLLFAVRAVTRSPVWADNGTLFTTTVRDHPENFRAQWFYAAELAEVGDAQASVPYWLRALEISPDSPGLLTDYAGFLLAGGDAERADRMAARALELRPDSPRALLVQGRADLQLDRPSQARARIQRLEEMGFRTLAQQLADSLAAAR